MRRSKAEQRIMQYIATNGSWTFLGFNMFKPHEREPMMKEILDRLEQVGIIKPDKPNKTDACEEPWLY